LLALKRAVGAVNAPPAIPYLWAYLGRREHLAGRRNAAPIETYAKNSICAQFAVMTRHGNDAVEAYRLHISAGAIYVRTLAHAGSQAQVVVHVFRIHPEHAAEVHSASDHPLIGVADKAADLAAAKATLVTMKTHVDKALQLSTAPGLPTELHDLMVDFQALVADFGKLLDAAATNDLNAVTSAEAAVEKDATKISAYNFDKISTEIDTFYKPLVDAFNSEMAAATA